MNKKQSIPLSLEQAQRVAKNYKALLKSFESLLTFGTNIEASNLSYIEATQQIKEIYREEEYPQEFLDMLDPNLERIGKGDLLNVLLINSLRCLSDEHKIHLVKNILIRMDNKVEIIKQLLNEMED
jgi:hypothetical protein